MTEKANSALIKKLNEIRLLNIIREEGPISRNHLSKCTKISKVTVSEISNRLIENKFVVEVGKGESTSKGGKRPTLIKLNPDGGYVIGIEIKRRHAAIALANFESKIKGIERITFRIGLPLDELIQILFSKIDLLLKNKDIERNKLLSICIGLPGFVDYTKGELIFADTLKGWTNQPLASRFSKRYGVPTIIENDVNIVTLGESLVGAGRTISNLACIWMGEGIGAGIMIEGQIVRGATGNAGELGYLQLGHFVTNMSRVKHLYTNQRYFGELLSEANLYDVLKMKLRWASDSNSEDIDQLSLESLVSRADKGDCTIQEIMDEYAFLLAILCMSMIKSINPSLIILNGRVIENSNYLLERVRQLVKQSMMGIPFQPSSIIVGELKMDAGVKGAIALALQTIFEPPLTKSKNYLKISC